MTNIAAADLSAFALKLFVAAGVPQDEASVVAESLVGANLRGHDSHGVLRVPQYIGFLERGEYRTGVHLRIEHETPTVIVCDGQWGLGQVQSYRLLDHLLPKAKSAGVAAGTARACGHIGRLGEYAERAAEAGLILLATVNNDGSGQRVTPPGGLEPRLGTNPLCVSVPTDDPKSPVVLDFGTSAAAEGKVRAYHLAGRPVPEGWLLDHRGQPTTDPSVLYGSPTGSILPLGGNQGYKGFGLGVVLDLLAAGLSGGHCSYPDPAPVRGNNVFFLVLDPIHFAGTDTLALQAGTLTNYLRGTPRVEGVEKILLPGDPERETLRKRRKDGIPLDGNQWKALLALAQRLGVTAPVIQATSTQE